MSPLDKDIAVLAKRKNWLAERIATAAKTGKTLSYDEQELEALNRVIDRVRGMGPSVPETCTVVRFRL